MDKIHQKRGVNRMLRTPSSAEGFYAKAGFAVRGEPFDEVGIAHVEMVVGVNGQGVRLAS
jgi:predicted GNAT family N-acyltransferase